MIRCFFLGIQLKYMRSINSFSFFYFELKGVIVKSLLIGFCEILTLSWALQGATQKYPATHITAQFQPIDYELYSHCSKHVLVWIFWWKVELEDELHHRNIQLFACNLEPNVCWSVFLSMYCPPSSTCQDMIENSDMVF